MYLMWAFVVVLAFPLAVHGQVQSPSIVEFPQYARSVSFAPDNSNNVFVARVGFGLQQSFWRSTDGGSNWVDITPTGYSQTDRNIVALANGVLVTSGVYNGQEGLLRSIDQGASWQRVHDFCFCGRIRRHPTEPATLFAGKPWGELIRSEDSGETWTTLANVNLVSPGIDDIAVAGATDERILLAGRYTGVLGSDDDGASWTSLGPDVPELNAIVLATDPSNPDLVWLGTSDHGLWRSDDKGDNWTQMVTGQSNPQVYALAFDTFGALYVGYFGWGASVLKTTDNGANWSDVAPGLKHANVVELAPHPSTADLVYLGRQP